MRLFFYGTLRDEDVRARVIGRRHSKLAVITARAPGWRAVYARGKTYPVLVRAVGVSAEGIMVEGIDAGALCRLRAFETGYRLARIAVQAGDHADAAWVFLPRRRLRGTTAPFVLETWRRRFKQEFLKRIGRRA